MTDRKSTRLNSSHTEIYTLSLHDALPISARLEDVPRAPDVRLERRERVPVGDGDDRLSPEVHDRSEEHTSELQSHRDLHSFPTRRSSDLGTPRGRATCPGCSPRTSRAGSGWRWGRSSEPRGA